MVDNPSRRSVYRESTTVDWRYHVYCPVCEDGIEPQVTKAGALELAARRARRCGHAVEVFDSMARRGAWQTWCVASDGVVTLAARRPLSDHNAIIVNDGEEE